MGTPTNRTPVRVARGTYSNLNTNKADIQGSEIVYATDQNKLYVKEGTDLVDANTQDISGKADLSGATFTGPITVGVDDTGHDVKFFGASTGRYWEWDEQLDKMVVNGQIDAHNQFNIKPGGEFFKFENTSAWHLVYDDSGSGNGWSYAIDTSKDWVKLYGPGGSGSTVVLQTKTTGVDVTGVLDVSGTVTSSAGVLGVGDALLAGDQTWTGAQRGTITALTDAATIAVDFNSSNNFSVTLGDNRVLGQPSNQTAGQSGSIFVTQDGTGSRTLSYHADWKWAGGTAPTLSTAASSVDRIDYIVAAANKIHAVATLAVA